MCASHTASEHRWHELGLGVHVCSIYRGKEQQFSPIIPFFSVGLHNAQQCVYIYNEQVPEEMASMHAAEAGELPSKLPSALSMVHYHEIYTKDGSFDPDATMDALGETIDKSLAQGYTGVRAVGEMSWVLSSSTPLDKFIEYEQKLNIFCPVHKVIGICQFDEEKFTQEFLIEMIRTHPYIILHG